MQDLATKFANLTIQSDFIFKKVMSRKRICKHLLEELLQIEIADINYLEAEKTLEPEYTSRGIRLDIIVADDKNTHYNLEMQVKNNKNPDTDTYVPCPSAHAIIRRCLILICCRRDSRMTCCHRHLLFLSVFLTSLNRIITFIPLKSVVWKIGNWSFRIKQPR